MNIFEKLSAVQSELNAPKNRENTFGKYTYRSCEDILEAVKPLLKKHKAAIRLTDSIEMVGDRYYVHAQALFYDIEQKDNSTSIFASADAYAREPEEKKGMDAAQITGTASSYARKYALNGLLLIDDAKDPDTDEYKKESDEKAARASKTTKKVADASVLDNYVTAEQIKVLEMLLKKADVGIDKFNSIYNLAIISELPADKFEEARNKLEAAVKVKEKGA